MGASGSPHGSHLDGVVPALAPTSTQVVLYTDTGPAAWHAYGAEAPGCIHSSFDPVSQTAAMEDPLNLCISPEGTPTGPDLFTCTEHVLNFARHTLHPSTPMTRYNLLSMSYIKKFAASQCRLKCPMNFPFSALAQQPYQLSSRRSTRLVIGLMLIVILGLAAGCSMPETTASRTEMPVTDPTPTAHSPTRTPVPAPTSAESTAPEPDVSDLQELELQFELIADNLDNPVFLTHAGDGSGDLFLVEQPGRILIWREGAVLSEPFLDIRERVGDNGWEQGLLGLAFAPDFMRTLHFYVNYTDVQGDTVIARLQVSPTDVRQGLADSEEQILTLRQPASNHNGGMLLFGPDRMLWIGTGDGGAAGDRFRNGQNPESLLGKMLRIDVLNPGAAPYALPPDNPWREELWEGQAVAPEIWALGLRNPWRYSFDRLTGDLWIADVGQDAFEEVHMVSADQAPGLNFGWPLMEGAHCFPQHTTCNTSGLEMPVAEFSQTDGECSITGGYVYRGSRTPSLQGRYIVGDFCSGRIWMIWNAGTSDTPLWSQELLVDTNMRISSFGEDEAGELYLLDLSGAVYRLHFVLP